MHVKIRGAHPYCWYFCWYRETMNFAIPERWN